ncbi:MAG: CapA family protein [Clostridiales bacterium]|nr:CapA family protein [Clostridiales bacterium]
MRIWKRLWAMRAVVCLAAGLAVAGVLSAGCVAAAETAPETGVAAVRQLVLTFAGDCTIGNDERLMGSAKAFKAVLGREGYGYFFAKTLPLFAADDLTVVNFEGALKDSGTGKVVKTNHFRGLPEYAQVLTQGSVEAVNLSNNHNGDYGSGGRRQTRAALSAADIDWFDDETACWFTRDGATVALIGFTRTAYVAKRDAYKAAVASLKEQGADAVVCFLHFGQEYARRHNAEQTKMARAMVDAGADLVIGTHPHVIQGAEVYSGATILYSIGNFVFGGNPSVRAIECIVARVTLTFGGDGRFLGHQVRVYPAHISGDDKQNDYQPRLVSGEAAEGVFAILDADSLGQPAPETVTAEYREYPFVPARQP